MHCLELRGAADVINQEVLTHLVTKASIKSHLEINWFLDQWSIYLHPSPQLGFFEVTSTSVLSVMITNSIINLLYCSSCCRHTDKTLHCSPPGNYFTSEPQEIVRNSSSALKMLLMGFTSKSLCETCVPHFINLKNNFPCLFHFPSGQRIAKIEMHIILSKVSKYWLLWPICSWLFSWCCVHISMSNTSKAHGWLKHSFLICMMILCDWRNFFNGDL